MPMTCTSQFQKNWPLSYTIMARVSASSPVEQPAERMRSDAVARPALALLELAEHVVREDLELRQLAEEVGLVVGEVG